MSEYKIPDHQIYFLIAFSIVLGVLPEIYDDLLSRIKEKCIRTESGLYIFSFKRTSNGVKKRNFSLLPEREIYSDESSYIVSKRRVISGSHPTLLCRADLLQIIDNHNILFYTGAGLSIGSNVPGMNGLHDLLELEIGENFLFSLEKVIDSPREFTDKIKVFHDACQNSIPTSAHYALRNICLLKNSQLITENLDCLHETSGMLPYRVNAEHLRNEDGKESLAQYEYVICVGLSYDDRGFLGWFKESNPYGKIVAIDLCQPSYLGDEDYWCSDDLQSTLDDVRNKLISISN